MTAADVGLRHSPGDIAVALGLDAPTVEQCAVISAPMSPIAVVAGAGSGKTETMAGRVVYLVANRLARPEEILGLTFTRKAARELAARIRVRLAQLRHRGMLPDEALDGEVNVATYDSYAGRLVAEHAVRLGREPNPRLLNPAMVFQLAESVLLSYDGPMDAKTMAPSTALTYLLDLHNQLSGHLVDHDELRAAHGRLESSLMALPGRGKGKLTKTLSEVVDSSAARVQLLDMVDALQAAKARTDSVDFADIATLAARIAAECPDVGEAERDRYQAVLLDEYQDTAFNQLEMLRKLFGSGHPVLAVGDPMQSIYSWRGASVGTLAQFVRDFPAEGDAEAPVFPLSISFRNRPAILKVANALTEPLRDGRVTVPALTSAHADTGEVRVGLFEDYDAELASIAEQFAVLWHEDAPKRAAEAAGARSMAVLLRRREGMTDYAEALRARGVEVEIVGLGGLLYAPAVADVYATLKILADPSDGAAMLRLLTGSRWRLGAADLAALGKHVRTANRRLEAARALPDEDGLTIVDAVAQHREVGGLSTLARLRVSRLAAELERLHERSAAPLPDLVAEVIRTLGLDIEVAARSGNVVGARADLDAFMAAAAEFSDSAEDARLSSFIGYLAAAEEAEDGLEPGHVQVSPHRVQIITVHGAKGLEWDVVAVASMCANTFPNLPKGVSPSKAVRLLPYDLRGDAGELPQLDLSSATNQTEAGKLVAAFDDACKDAHQAEERRLAYVAVTRARCLLICTAYRRDHRVGKPRGVSVFLTQIRDVVAALPGGGVVLEWAAEPEVDDAEGPERRESPWPYDGLGDRRAVVEAGADAVRSAAALLAVEPPEQHAAHEADFDALAGPDGPARWQAETDLVLAELARRRSRGPVEVELPHRLSVSQLVELRRDPVSLARRLRRPVPAPPNPQARRGTAFHTWLEQQFGQPALLDVTELPGSADDGSAGDDHLPRLQAAFRRSDWSGRTPLEVEAPFELVLDGVVVRGRVDAVYGDEVSPPVRRRDDAAVAQLSLFDEPDEPRATGARLEVVDWKTGAPPSGRQATVAAVQLAAYRLAFAHLYRLDLDQVSAAFHYVADDVTVRPADLLDADGLRDLLRSVEPRVATGG